jgi:hypothetical protein
MRGAIFVYYKVGRERVELLRAAFERAAVAPFPAFPCIRRVELMRRSGAGSPADLSDAAQTWMEIYWLEQWPIAAGNTSGGWEPGQDLDSLQQAIEDRAREAGIIDLVEGTRHYEAFDSCA